jgi:hypothetical protein
MLPWALKAFSTPLLNPLPARAISEAEALVPADIIRLELKLLTGVQPCKDGFVIDLTSAQLSLTSKTATSSAISRLPRVVAKNQVEDLRSADLEEIQAWLPLLIWAKTPAETSNAKANKIAILFMYYPS